MSTHMCLALMVIMILFHNVFDVVRSAVLVVGSPGWYMRFTPAVILTRLGYVFFGN